MTLGQKIRNLRLEHNYSQPELAQRMGIEQSYLSKLENDKSIPSNDVFRILLKAFDLPLTEFMSSGELLQDRERLLQIPDAEAWLKQRSASRLNRQRHFLYTCSALIVLAVGLFYTGFSKKVFSETHFQYESQGVVKEGENKDIFRNWMRLVNRGDIEQFKQKEIEMTQRQDNDTLLLTNYQGPEFEMTVADGRRLYYLDKELQLPRAINAWLEVFGVMLFAAGIIGFVAERRLFEADN